MKERQNERENENERRGVREQERERKREAQKERDSEREGDTENEGATETSQRPPVATGTSGRPRAGLSLPLPGPAGGDKPPPSFALP